ncbi:hypothetical protein AMR41_06935 [Hapalosiphon sp. MRB220]|nr:hypothetical protein AMR41_06935 [Hapalosiphon sp. MRB220]
MKKILILAANPKDTSSLRLGEEAREIQAALKRSKNRENFEIFTEWAVRVDDLRRALLDHEPTIVHFSGHGSGTTGLVLENNLGQMQLVSTESLARLFKLFQNKTECVLLNACYSKEQADAIYQHIDYVIGMNRAIGDIAAIQFAVGFYDALGAGNSYENCFEVGCTSLDLEGIPESDTPVMKARPRLNSVSAQEVELNKNIEAKNEKPSYSGGISQSVSGGKMYGGMQAVQGNYNQQTMRIKNTNSEHKKQLNQQDIIQFLLKIEQLIQANSDLTIAIKEKSLRYLGAAKEEVKLDEPDKQLTAGNLKRMAEILKIDLNIWEDIKQILLKLSVWLDVDNNFFSF